MEKEDATEKEQAGDEGAQLVCEDAARIGRIAGNFDP